MANVRALTEKLQTSVDNLNKISGKIASGEGTIGKLVNGEEGYNEVISTLDSIQGGVETLSGTIGAISKFKLDLDMQGYYLEGQEESLSRAETSTSTRRTASASTARASSAPRRAKRREKTQAITTTLPGRHDRDDDHRDHHQRGRPRAHRPLRLPGRRRTCGSGRASSRAPAARRSSTRCSTRQPLAAPSKPSTSTATTTSRRTCGFSARWQFHPNLYVIGGYDDALENDSLFLGGGIRWNDDNLKYLLGAVPLN